MENNRYDKSNINLKQECRKVKRLPLSVCIMFYEGDKGYLQHCLNTIPKGVEICVMQNIKTDNLHHTGYFDMGKEENEELVLRKAKNVVYHTLFSFGECRNQLISMATRDWVLYIDPDEQFWYTEHLDHVFNMPGNIGAASVTVLSHDIIPGKGIMHRDANHQYRIFRNHKGFRFLGNIHEQILPSIVSSGYDVVDTPIIIRHDGYMSDEIEIIQKKLKRNVSLLFSVLSNTPQDYYSCERLASHLFDLQQNGYYKHRFVDNRPERINNIKEIYKALCINPDNEELLSQAWKHLMYLQEEGKFKLEIRVL